ncbi:MAG: lysophospholipid acyltransferase family protein [Planctomycetota bacterium]
MDELDLLEGAYRSPAASPSWFSRTFPSLSFHPRFFAITVRAGAAAKRGRYGGFEWAQSSLEVLRALESVGMRFEVNGLDRLEALDSPCVIAGNHMGVLETCIIPGLVQPYRNTTFVIKPSLVKYPIFKHVMLSRDPIVVSQSNPRHDFKVVMRGGAERLKQGTSIVVFPQGRRTPTFDPADFNTMAVKLAQRAGVPVVPLALKTDAWALGKWAPDFGRIDPQKSVHFAFGEPVTVEGRGADEQEEVIRYIVDHLQVWNANLAGSAAGPEAIS